MDNERFKEFLKAARIDEKVTYGFNESELFRDVINEIYQDVSKFKFYTLDGRFQDLLVKLLKTNDYKSCGYQGLLKDLKTELQTLIVDNIMLLPINFLKSLKCHSDLELNDYMNIFFPTEDDLKNFKDVELIIRQEKRMKDKMHKLDDNLCRYFEKILNAKLDKEHILLVKDRAFFNYPILALHFKNIDFKVEKESGRIAEAVYSILRMVDFAKAKSDYGRGLLERDWLEPAHTYVVYYNSEYPDEKSYYGHSFRFNFSYFLDISTDCFIENQGAIVETIDLYIKTCFLDKRTFTTKDINIINKWNNAILLFNTAYEFASIEKYDACVLVLCSILESLFLKNEGRNKVDKLIEEITLFYKEDFPLDKLKRINEAIKNIYKYRNKILHEGLGYETKFLFSRSLTSYQGIYRGMKPFKYQGAIYPYEEIVNIEIIITFIINVLMDTHKIDEIKNLINK